MRNTFPNKYHKSFGKHWNISKNLNIPQGNHEDRKHQNNLSHNKKTTEHPEKTSRL